MIINRLKQNEDTLCTYTLSGTSIKEGDILGHGDNYPCVVLYNPFEAKFVALEFGYMESEGYLYREHNIRSYTCQWTILGSIDNKKDFKKMKKVPKKFDYFKDIEKCYL